MEKFVHLHLHTQFSLLDGAARIEKLVKVAKERGDKAIAMTDHGNMYGAVRFYKACRDNDIKPIIGTEFYVCDDMTIKSGKPHLAHLIILAKNNAGYKNLIKLNSIAFIKGFYYKPRIDYKTLAEHSEGLICLSACLAGDIPQYMLQSMDDEAEKLAIKLKGMFAPGDFYIEIQDHGITDERIVLPRLIELAKKIDVKLVATNDVHYINKEDAEVQDILMCVQMGKFADDPDRLRFETDELYYKTHEQMLELFSYCPEAIVNTVEVADKCEVTLDFKSKFYPIFDLPAGYKGTKEDYLREQTFEGLKKIYGESFSQEHTDRAEYELGVLLREGYEDYYLVVADFIAYAKSIGVPVGPGRGSGAASIVAYALGITMVDPIRYDLYFERFLNPERVSPPDFDIDFCPDRRGEVIDYVIGKYGADNVSQIITFGTMAAKAAIKDVARVLRVPYSEVDRITKAFPVKLPKAPVIKKIFGLDDDPKWAGYATKELVEIYGSDPSVQKVVDIAIKAENMPRNTSIHAAGVVICCDPIDEHIALAKNGDMVTTQLDMRETEEMGLLKMDFLGLITLTDIDATLKLIKKLHNIDIDFYNMEYDDPKVYELISSGDCDGIFQIESGGFTKFIKELKPTRFEDIIMAGAIFRPGPMDEIPRYLKNKRNPDKIEYSDPRLEPILSETSGVMIYQEQVMRVCQVLAGYTMGQADGVRKIMGKKLVDKLPAEKERFINGWVDPEGKKSIDGVLKRGMKREVAEKLWSEMEKFGSYAFNKAHSACYGYITYQTAYLKTYYTLELYTAILNNRITNNDEVNKYVERTREHNIEVLPPDINHSYAGFMVEGKAMRFGLAALKGVGYNVCEMVTAERDKNGPFKDLSDFCERVDNLAMNKRFLESMILSGAFDCFKAKRSQMMQAYERIVDRVITDRRNNASGQVSLFDTVLKTDNKLNAIQYADIAEFPMANILKFEKEVIGVYISGHPLDAHRNRFKAYSFNSSMFERELKDSYDEDGEQEYVYAHVENKQSVVCGGLIISEKRVSTRNGNREMAILEVEDLEGSYEVMVFPNVYEKIKNTIKVDAFVTINGKVSIREGEDEPIILAEKIELWEDEKPESIATVPQKPVEKKVKQEKPKRLLVKFDTMDEGLLEDVCKILRRHPGNNQVVFKCTQQDKAFAAKLTVDAQNILANELCALLPADNVKIDE